MILARAGAERRRLIAKHARIGVSRVEIVAGARARSKTVRVSGMSASALRSALGLADETPSGRG